MDKQEMLDKIKEIVVRHGGLLTRDLMEIMHPPIYAMITQDHFSTCEEFYPDHCTVISWERYQESDRTDVLYIEMDEQLLEDILDELEDFDNNSNIN